MKPAIAAALVALAASCATPAPVAKAATYADAWYTFADPGLGDRYMAVNLYETERQLSGRLVLADGSAVALRLLPPLPGQDLSFIAPAVGASFVATRHGEREWRGLWTEPKHGEAVAMLVPATSAPTEAAGQFAILPDGRRMHMVCAGEGAPAVILDYGAGGTVKKDWGNLAAAIASAADTRVCAYDRAGRGLSDPAAPPRTASAVASDIEQMLTAANIPTPVVLVGHSLGSYHVRQFANAYFAKTAGLILVDPSGDGQMGRFAAAVPKLVEEQNKVTQAQAGLGCITKLRDTPVAPDDPLARMCGGNDPDAIDATRSEIAEMPGASTTALVVSRRSYGDMPVIVLTRGDYDKGMPPSMTAEDRAGMRVVWETMHAEMAALSRRGEQRFIAGAGHYIQSDAPQAVIDAVRDVVAAARVKKS